MVQGTGASIPSIAGSIPAPAYMDIMSAKERRQAGPPLDVTAAWNRRPDTHQACTPRSARTLLPFAAAVNELDDDAADRLVELWPALDDLGELGVRAQALRKSLGVVRGLIFASSCYLVGWHRLGGTA